MLRSFAISTSGLQHAELRLRATSRNAANIDTRQTAVTGVQGTEVSSAGVSTAIIHRREQRLVSPPFGFDVNVLVQMMRSVHHAGAMADVVRTSDDMVGRLLDIPA